MIFRRSLLGLAVVLAAIYASLPAIAAFLLPRVLAPSGVSASHFDVGYPGWSGVDVTSFDMRFGHVSIAGERGRVTYRLRQLLQGRCDAVTLARLTVRLGGEESATGNARFALPPFWALVPAERVSIEQIDLASANPAAEAHGTLRFDPDVLEAHLNVASPLLAVPLVLNATTYPDGRVLVTVTQSEVAEPLLALTGVPDANHDVIAIDGHVALSGTPLALATAYAHTTLASGSIAVELQGSAPWPMQFESVWHRFTGQGRFAVSAQGQMPQVPDVFAQLSGTFAIHDETVAAQLDAGSVLRVDLPALRSFVGQSAPRLTVTADTAVNIEYGDQGLRVDEGLVVSAPIAGSPVSVRARGARGADGHMDLAVTTLDGAPVVLATAQAADVDGTAVLTVHTEAALAGKLFGLLAAVTGVKGATGHLIADFDGTIPWPLEDSGVLQNVSGKGSVTLASAGHVSATRTFDTTVAGEYTLEGGRLIAKIAPGAHVLLAADGVEATTIGAVAIAAQLDGWQIDVKGVDCKLALPEIALGKRKVTLSDAWVTAERLTWTGDTVAADLVVRTHTGSDAFPARLTIAHDLEKGLGQFSVSVDWHAKKPLLAKQLPGFNAPFDLDEGRLRIDIKGNWDLAHEPSVRGAGHVQLDAPRAHYDTYTVSGISADLPIIFSGDAYVVAAAPIAIDTIDVGFPMTRITLNLAVANEIAQVSDLRGAVLGGDFSAEPFDYVLPTDAADVDVHVAAIDLAQVLALEGNDVKGSGVLDGLLPIRLSGDVVAVVEGHIAARAPGGTLVYKSAASASMAAQSGMGFVFKALEDFRYDVLDAKVALATDGALALAVRLQGRNPAVENGRTIAFNLNLNESLPALLQSLRAADNITNRIEGKFSQ